MFTVIEMSRRAAGPPGNLALLLTAIAAGCVDVPDRSPMGGEPMVDAEAIAPDAAESDGARPDIRPPEDEDDPAADPVDGGWPDDEVLGAGRPGDAGPEPYGQPPVPRHALLDPERCPEGGALLYGLEACAVVEAIAPLPEPRTAAAAAALSDGRVVVAGGRTDDGEADGAVLVLDGDDWRDGPPLPLPSFGSRAVAVDDRIWVVGGHGPGDIGSALQIIDPDGEAEPVARLLQAREADFTVDVLGDGRVVIAGGQTPGGIAGAEVADPEAEHVLGPMLVERRAHASAVDTSGALWLIGGFDRRGQARFAPEVLHPEAIDWVSAPGPAAWGATHAGAAPTGDTVLVAGGCDLEGRSTRRAAIYDHGTRQWRSVGGLNMAQSALWLAPLGDRGAVLAVGPGTVEIYDPVEAAFFLLPVPSSASRSAPAMVAVEGAVLVVGGEVQGRTMALGYRVRLAPALPPGEPEPVPEE